MNKLTIIGNLTADPELRSTPSGKNVCNFNVAVNRKVKVEGQPDADFFRVSAWNKLGESCGKYLTKGKKVCVVGAVSMRMYTAQNGETRGTLEVNADDVEFLSPKSDSIDAQSGMQKVEPEGLPY